MSKYLPSYLLNLFKPRPQLEQVPKEVLPPEPHEREYSQRLSGVASLVNLFEDPKDTPPPQVVKSKEQRKAEKREKAEARNREHLERARSEWDPEKDPNAQGDPYKTLFVGRLSYDITEEDLRREMETYGPVRQVAMVRDRVTGKPRGYAFVEFEHERDMRAAYRYADGQKINGRRIVVDFERGRTVDGWYPRRLGGGLGGTRIGGPDQNVKASGRYDPNRHRRIEQRASRERSRQDEDRRSSRRDRDRSRERGKSRDQERDRDRDRERDRYREEKRRERRSSRYDRY